MKTVVSALLALISLCEPATAQAGRTQPARNVVLVHGAFADGSSWSKVIPLLQAKGLHVTSVGNPLTSFEDDVNATRRAIAMQEGPVVLVGHSYGGSVITEAGNDPKVASLVYVAAFAPDAGQTITELGKDYPKPLYADELQNLADGFLVLSPKAINEDFAQDLPPSERALVLAVQTQTAGSVFAAKPSAAAWKMKPSWYIVTSKDRMIWPEQQRKMAKQIKAETTVIPSSHVPMLSHPREVATVIAAAAAGLKDRGHQVGQGGSACRKRLILIAAGYSVVQRSPLLWGH
jgi:pimeloyl-ACP methyl ester carboxylesterase